MNRVRLSILATIMLLCIGQATAQKPSSDADPTSAPRNDARGAVPGQSVSQPVQPAGSSPFSAGSTIPVMLEKWVDARKNKVGDEVLVRTTEQVKADGRVVLPKGSRIVGHVTVIEAKANTRDDSQSLVGIAFDHAVLKDGHEIPLAVIIQAIAPAAVPTVSSDMGTAPGTAGGSTGGAPPMPGQGNAMDPNAGTPGRIASPVNGGQASTGDLTASGGLTPQCRGVLGIDGLVLAPETSDPTQGSVIASQRRNVRLDGRTQMMLRVKGS